MHDDNHALSCFNSYHARADLMYPPDCKYMDSLCVATKILRKLVCRSHEVPCLEPVSFSTAATRLLNMTLILFLACCLGVQSILSAYLRSSSQTLCKDGLPSLC